MYNRMAAEGKIKGVKQTPFSCEKKGHLLNTNRILFNKCLTAFNKCLTARFTSFFPNCTTKLPNWPGNTQSYSALKTISLITSHDQGSDRPPHPIVRVVTVTNVWLSSTFSSLTVRSSPPLELKFRRGLQAWR